MNKIIHFFRDFGKLLKDTFVSWNSRDPFRNSAVIAYYTIFSLPGLLVIVINLAGYFLGEEALTNSVSEAIGSIIGPSAANDVQELIANAYKTDGTLLSSIVSIGTLLFGATGVFYQVQQSLNIMWDVQPKPTGVFIKLLKDRLFSFGMILIIGFLLLVSLVLSSLLTICSEWLTKHVFEHIGVVIQVVDFCFSLGVVTVLFATIFKFLPDAKIRWKDVWVGAILTAVLFVIAKIALGHYFGVSNPGSTYGAASSVILIMLWTTYTAMILLFGAEFTRLYARHIGHEIKLPEYSKRIGKKRKQSQVGFGAQLQEQTANHD